MKIILLSGKATHGKDSAANMLKEKLEQKGKVVLIAHYGDLVKYVAKTFFNWNGEKDDCGRTLLQEVGTDKVRKIHPNFWVDFVGKIIAVFHYKWDYVLIPDTRFPNEIDLMKSNFNNVIALRVVRTNYTSPLSIEQQNHRSETALDNYDFDYFLYAENLEELDERVEHFLKILENN